MSKSRGRLARVGVFGALAVLASTLAVVAPQPGSVSGATVVPTRVWTTSADFDEGILEQVNYDVPDQLSLDSEPEMFEFIWVALSGRGTVAKINTQTGEVVGEYWSAPQNRAKNPSRTSVDYDGSVWVGNRNEASTLDGVVKGSVVHIGLEENGQCVDRNGNGVIDTSSGLGDIRPWPNASPFPDTDGGVDTAADECVVHYVRTNGRNIRHVSVDLDNNVWVAGSARWFSGPPRVYDLISPDGEILRSIDMRDVAETGASAPIDTCCYGGLVDSEGIMWSAAVDGPLLRIDPSKPAGDPDLIRQIPVNVYSYGVGLSPDGHVWVSNWRRRTIQKFAGDGTLVGTFPTTGNEPRGVVVSDDGDVWVANSTSARVTRLRPDGSVVAQIPVGNFATGVAVDQAGKVWVTNTNSHNVMRIDPATNTVDLTIDLRVPGLPNPTPYNYSDMTGATLSAPPDTGSWTVVHDAAATVSQWDAITWNAEVPGDSSLRVFAASSTDGVSFGPDVQVTAGERPAVDAGQFLRIRVEFSRSSDGASPVLFDLTLGSTNEPPVANAGPDQTVVEADVVTLDGSGSSDPDGDPLSFAWRLVGFSGPPITLTSTTQPSLSFATADDGTYTFELTVSDGLHTATDRVTVRVVNADPVLDVSVQPAAAGGVTLLSGSFTDAGFVDTHATTVDWGDGSAVESLPVAAQGAGWGSVVASHVYDTPGSYAVRVVLVDDDGGTDTVEVGVVEISAATALFAASSTAARTLWVTGDGQRIDGATHSNNELRVDGATKTFTGPSTYAGSLRVAGAHSFDPPATATGVQPLPVELIFDDYRPGGRAATEAGDAFFDMTSACGRRGWSPSAPLQPGLYFVPCAVTVRGAELTAGPVTIASTGRISVSGAKDEFFEPFIDGALFITNRTGPAISVSGAESTFAGMLYAPSGGIDLLGSGHRFICGIIGGTIRVAGGNTQITARDCTRRVEAPAASALVPSLQVGLTQAPTTVLPGDVITDDVSVTNTGAVLLVPTVVGAQNLSDVDSVTVTDGTVAVEYLSATDGLWRDVPGDLHVTTQPSPHPLVTYSPGGFAGTTISPGGFATWGVQAQVLLDPATTMLLLDATQVASVRVNTDIVLDPVGVPVRTLGRHGADVAAVLRAQGADITDVQLRLLTPSGQAELIDTTSEPGFAALAPGASVQVARSSDVAVPEPIGAVEPAAAYLQRLTALDGATHSAVAAARGTGGVGLVLSEQTHAVTTQQMPVVAGLLTGEVTIPAGTDTAFSLGVRNTGRASAEMLDAQSSIDGDLATIGGLPTALVPAGVGTGTISHHVDDGHPGGALVVRSTHAWADTNNNTYGPIRLEHNATVQAAPTVTATLRDRLAEDRDSSGQPSPGDLIAYDAAVTNTSTSPLGAATFTLERDTASALAVGSVTTSHGTVTSGNTAGDSSIIVDLTGLASGATATIGAAVIVADPFPDAQSRLSVQAVITGDDLDPTLSDDPDVFGSADPTVTPIIRIAAALELQLDDVLLIDTNGDGQAGPGDQLRYVATINPAGNAAVHDVTFTVTPDAASHLVAGSVTTTRGTIATGNTPGDSTVTVEVGDLGPFDGGTVTFDVTIPTDTTATQLSVQGALTSPDLAVVLSDDPDTAALRDPTITVLTSDGTPPVPAGPTVTGCEPGDGATITEPVAFTCSITPLQGTTVAQWNVVAAPADDTAFEPILIAAGEGAPPTPLGNIDPTLLPNGILEVTVTAIDNTGGATITTTTVVVDGQLKLGRYHITYQDLAVPVGGIPIQVLRTYDALNKNRVGDFGHGWDLDVSNFRVQTNRPLGAEGWERYQCGGGIMFVTYCFKTNRPHYVTVTWPDGRTETFDFTPQGEDVPLAVEVAAGGGPCCHAALFS